MFSSTLSVLLILAGAATQVAAHGFILAANGANGVKAQGFGVDPSTPRDGSSPNPFEQDTSIIRDREIEDGKSSACGRTKIGGSVDIEGEMNTAVKNGLATAAADGSVTMTIHQVNQDGAGPYSCDVDTTGTGQNFVNMDVTQNVPGKDFPILGSLSRAKATDFTLVAKMPANAKCTGAGGACLVRCRNNAIAGPFGGCAAVTTASGNSTKAANNKASEKRDIGTVLKRVVSDDDFATISQFLASHAHSDEEKRAVDDDTETIAQFLATHTHESSKERAISGNEAAKERRMKRHYKQTGMKRL